MRLLRRFCRPLSCKTRSSTIFLKTLDLTLRSATVTLTLFALLFKSSKQPFRLSSSTSSLFIFAKAPYVCLFPATLLSFVDRDSSMRCVKCSNFFPFNSFSFEVWSFPKALFHEHPFLQCVETNAAILSLRLCLKRRGSSKGSPPFQDLSARVMNSTFSASPLS